MVFWVFQAIKYFKLSNNQNFITRMESDFLYPIFSTISSHSSAKSKSSKQHKCSIEKSCHFIFVAKSTENRKINMAKKAATPNEGPEKLITTNTEKKMWFPRFVYVCVCVCFVDACMFLSKFELLCGRCRRKLMDQYLFIFIVTIVLSHNPLSISYQYLSLNCTTKQ